MLPIEDYEVDTLRHEGPPVLAWLVEYETVTARHPDVWESRRELVFTKPEADAMATNPLYCRNKRLTALGPIGVQEDRNG